MRSKFGPTWRVTVALALVLALLPLMATPVGASPDVTITPGNADVDADTYVTGVYTDLPHIVIAELNAGEIGNGTILLDVPAGFEFRTDPVPTVSVSGTTPELAAQFTSITTARLTVTVTAVSTTKADALTISGLGVRPLQGTPLAQGDILMHADSTSAITGVTE